MSTNKLDQPDNHSDNHHLISVAYLSIATSAYTGHLVMWYPRAPKHMPSHCGELNPMKIFPLKELLETPCTPEAGSFSTSCVTTNSN